MQHLSIDIETYSSVNLQKAGVYKYAESPDFDILLFGYSVDGGAVHVIDLACGEKIPSVSFCFSSPKTAPTPSRDNGRPSVVDHTIVQCQLSGESQVSR